MKNITYVFQAGRTERLTNMDNSAKEFFYGYFHIKEKLNDVNLLEFDLVTNSELNNYINQFLRKISGLPFFSDLIINKKNKKTLLESKTIVCTNQRVGFSLLPMLWLNSKKNINSIVFVMGLFNNNPKNFIKKFFRIFFIKIFMKTFTNIVFLSAGEYKFVKNNFPQYKNKIHFLPFSIDQKFWTFENSDNSYKTNKNVLFIGNDGKRDYEFVIELASKMRGINFTFITKQIKIDQIKSKNVTLLNGKWDDSNITDLDIKNYYQNSSISIIPIFKSLQPSGQSVALQSLSMGIPVLITKSEGFWEPSLFTDNKHIIFVEKNKVDLWKNKIEDILSNSEKYNLISSEGKKLVTKNNNLETFSEKLLEIISS